MNRRAPFADRMNDALALLAGKHTLRCPVIGCGLRIRIRAVTPDEAARLTALANDHTRHEPKR
ncbi:hypothetical protein [Streptomyces formicae]|uniref:Uncharacterized protein n=1 Tax=Streptomyces formicae TaxID=1616117 RepID=A0ABY3WXL5_9ACTN|nr:hypothetical protein [Streptomyces formicae]UNM16042.1 hypothetical protein J4032_35345 [Streptomyces formicae]